MKSQKGITLVSLTIYIIGMTLMIAIVSLISNYFYTNAKSVLNTVDPLAEYTKITSILTQEINHSNINVLACGEDYIVFDNGIQYSFVKENKGIYKNMVKIGRNIENCRFEHVIKQGKDVVNVKITIGDEPEKNVDYTLKK